MALSETLERDASFTTHVLKGELPEVTSRMAEILLAYHPLGYGTQVRYLSTNIPDKGDWVCRIWRANSCE